MQKEKYKINKLEKGFTLIETILYVGIIGLILTSMIGFIISIQEPREKVYGQQETDANARFILNEISKQIRMADSINVASSIFDTDPGSLSLEMADPSKNPTLIYLDADDGNCLISFGTDPAIILNSAETKITNLTFMNLTGNGDRENLKINLEVETIASQDSPAYGITSLTTSITLRK